MTREEIARMIDDVKQSTRSHRGLRVIEHDGGLYSLEYPAHEAFNAYDALYLKTDECRWRRMSEGCDAGITDIFGVAAVSAAPSERAVVWVGKIEDA